MGLKQILEDKDIVASEKLVKVNEAVAAARKEYGNEDVDIKAPKVNTTEGMVDIKYLSDADKVVHAKTAINTVIANAMAHTDTTEGSVFDREVERLLATNAILCNLTAESGSKYL